MRRIANRLRPRAAVLAFSLLAAPWPVSAAAPAVPPAPKPPVQELALGGRTLLGVVATLRIGGHDEAAYRAEVGRTQVAAARFGAAQYQVTTAGKSAAHALAVGPAGAPLALLVPAPCPDGQASGCHALVTLKGTRLTVWALYAGPPSGWQLMSALHEALEKTRQPLAIFDPKFVARGPPGPDRYVLK